MNKINFEEEQKEIEALFDKFIENTLSDFFSQIKKLPSRHTVGKNKLNFLEVIILSRRLLIRGFLDYPLEDINPNSLSNYMYEIHRALQDFHISLGEIITRLDEYFLL